MVDYETADMRSIKMKDCIGCKECLPVGEGDHFCNVVEGLVLEDYLPTDLYAACNFIKDNEEE